MTTGPSASTSRTASLARSSASIAVCVSSGFQALPTTTFASSSSRGAIAVVKIACSAGSTAIGAPRRLGTITSSDSNASGPPSARAANAVPAAPGGVSWSPT